MKWIVMVVAIVAIVGVGFVAFSGSDNEGEESSAQSVQESSDSTQERSTLNRLFARGENLECTYSYSDDSGNASAGMAYFSQERMFGDFTVSQADGTELQSNVLKVDNSQYVWSKDSKEGYKIDLSVLESFDETESDEESDEEQGIDQDEEYDFDCKSWAVDESKFEVPSDVAFTDNSAIIQSVQDNIEQAGQLCASLEGEAQAACEQAVGAQ